MTLSPPVNTLPTPSSPSRHLLSRKLFTVIVAALIAFAAIAFSTTFSRGIVATRLIPTALRKSHFNVRSISTPSVELVTFTPASTMSKQKCSAAEERQWNSLAMRMDQFHNHFRYEFNRVYTLCDGGFHKEGMTLPRFLRQAQELAQHLDMHHRIETYIFPVLGKKMPQFKAGARESGEHLKSHKAIHEGLDKYEAFLAAALANPSSYSATTLRAIMDGFRDILFRHLDEEVHDLGSESMKAAGWTLQELRQIPM